MNPAIMILVCKHIKERKVLPKRYGDGPADVVYLCPECYDRHLSDELNPMDYRPVRYDTVAMFLKKHLEKYTEEELFTITIEETAKILFEKGEEPMAMASGDFYSHLEQGLEVGLISRDEWMRFIEKVHSGEFIEAAEILYGMRQRLGLNVRLDSKGKRIFDT